MTRTWNICISIAGIFFLLTSCDKYLDQKANLTQSSPSTLADAQALLDYSTTMNIATTPSRPETSSDDYFLLSASFNAVASNLQNSYLWIPYDYLYPNDWSTAYQPVYVANYCLEITRQQPLTQGNAVSWNNVQGSALFYRSYYFWQLLMAHAKAYDSATASRDSGIALRLESDFNVLSKRATVQACYDQILSDTKTAAGCLENKSAHPMRPSKAAAYGLLARIYLSMGQYDSALIYSSRFLAIAPALINYNTTPCTNCDIVAAFTATGSPFKKFNSETVFYTEMNGSVTSHSTSRALIDTVLYGAYATNDLRKSAFFTASGKYQKFKGSYAQSTSAFFTGITGAEGYLINAESYARTGNTVKAMEVLNALLVTRWRKDTFAPLAAVDKADAIAKILLERRKELVFRGLRWTDLKRMNQAGTNLTIVRKIDDKTYSLKPNANYYALPLPKDIITITGMEQNPF